MNRNALQLLAATTAALALSATQAFACPSTDENPFDAAGDGDSAYVAFEANYPSSGPTDIALLPTVYIPVAPLDLPNDYYSESASDSTVVAMDEAFLMAGDPLETP